MRATSATAIAGLALDLLQGPAGPAVRTCNLNGDTVNVSFYYPNLNTKIHDAGDSVVPSFGIDPAGFKYAAVGVTAYSITIDYRAARRFESGEFHGYVFKDLTRGDISKVTLSGTTDVSGLDASRLRFDADSISLNMAGLSYVPGRRVQLDVTLSCGPPLTSALVSPPAS